MKTILAAAAAVAAMEGGATEVKVMSTGAVKAAFSDAADAWSKASGHKVNASFDPAGPLRQKLAAGERGDVLIIPVENFAALEKDGIIAPGTRAPDPA